MANYQSGAGDFLPLAGGTLTGNLNIGLNSLIMHAGGKGGIIKGDSTEADKIVIRNIADSSLGKFSVSDFSLTNHITMQPNRNVDGVDVSELAANLYNIKYCNGADAIHFGDTNETQLKAYTIPGHLLGANGSLRLKADGMSYGTNGDKTFRLKLDGYTIATIVQPAGAPEREWNLFAICHNNNNVLTQNWAFVWTDNGVITAFQSGKVTMKDSTGNLILEITVQLASATLSTAYCFGFSAEVFSQA